jgi:hypothetical protein
MKILLATLRWMLVWLVICLLAVDPASACRLLAGRCCRCVCSVPACDCGPVIDETPVDKAADREKTTEPARQAAPAKSGEPNEPSPSDAPPGASPAVPPNAIQPRQSQAPAKREMRAAEPAGESSQQAAIPLRRPADVTPAPAVEASAPVASATPFAPSPRPEIAPSPAPAALGGPQSEPAAIDSHNVTASATPTSAESAEIQPAPFAPRRLADEPMPLARPMEPAISPRSPALPSAVDVQGPVAQPEFPPTQDDPFAPIAPSHAPAVKQPDADDPFAPLPAAPQSRRKPASPTTVQRGSQLADPLTPAAEGRLTLREWVDGSGHFRVQARLILVLDGKVRLLKETGRTTTVALERLSAADRAYVAEVVARYGSDLTKLDQLAAR